MPGRKKLIIVSVVIILGLLLLAGFFRQHYCVPILMYHSVGPGAPRGYGLAVSPLTLERQMRFLKKNHYNVMRLKDLGDLIREKKKIPSRTVAITFDDGLKNNYTYAFHILKKYNLPATIFVIIDEIGRPQGDKLDWNEIREMQDSGIVDFGSHSMGPEPLTNIRSEAELRRQVFDSKKILEEKLGRRVSAFSYPEGRFNSQIRQLVIDAGYMLAVATNPGRHYSNNDIFALKRLRISENSSNLFVFALETSGFYTFIKELHKNRHEKK
jgi:peptidoglycan/xylan/chitin deacetylase (PgdA/CDA1 family)